MGLTVEAKPQIHEVESGSLDWNLLVTAIFVETCDERIKRLQT